MQVDADSIVWNSQHLVQGKKQQNIAQGSFDTNVKICLGEIVGQRMTLHRILHKRGRMVKMFVLQKPNLLMYFHAGVPQMDEETPQKQVCGCTTRTTKSKCGVELPMFKGLNTNFVPCCSLAKVILASVYSLTLQCVKVVLGFALYM